VNPVIYGSDENLTESLNQSKRNNTVISRKDEKGKVPLGRVGRALTRAIVLLSGGIDSATALYLTKRQTDDIHCLTMIYSDAYDAEAEASRRIASAAHVKHQTVLLPFFKELEQRFHPPASPQIASAYVPARNIVFYGVAAAFAETLGASLIVFGSNADDARELPDARPEFIQPMNELIWAGTRAGREGVKIQIVNPLIDRSKLEVLKLAFELMVPLNLTWSCYENAKAPCGKCRGCVGRRRAFEQLGVADPLSAQQTHR
jgi:7-cyano-7-deazaguanine synthase